MPNTVIPDKDIVIGLFTCMGITYPPAAPPVGSLLTPHSEGSDEDTDINGCGYGRTIYKEMLEWDWKFLPFVYIQTPSGNPGTPIQIGSKVGEEVRVYRVHYTADNRGDTLTSSPLVDGDGNPEQVVIARCSRLRDLVDDEWKTLGTSLRLNAHVGGVTFENDMDEHYRRNNKDRLCASFDVTATITWSLT